MARVILLSIFLFFFLGCRGESSPNSTDNSSVNAEGSSNRNIEEEKLRALKEIEKNIREMKESAERKEGEAINANLQRSLRDLEKGSAELQRIVKENERRERLQKEMDANWMKEIQIRSNSANVRVNRPPTSPR